MAARSAVCLGFLMLVVLAQQATGADYELPSFLLQYGPEENKVGRPKECFFMPDSGPCYYKSKRFYYDVKSGICRSFFYGGCKGNSNNFESEEECEQECGRREVVCPDGRLSLPCSEACSTGECPEGYTCNTEDERTGVCCPDILPTCPDGNPSNLPCDTTVSDSCPPAMMCMAGNGTDDFCCPARCSDGTTSNLPCTPGTNTCPSGSTCTSGNPGGDLCCPARCMDGTISIRDCESTNLCPPATRCISQPNGLNLCCPDCPGGLRPDSRGCDRPNGSPCSLGYQCVTTIFQNGVCCAVNCSNGDSPSSVGCMPGSCPLGEVCNVAVQPGGVCCPRRP